MCFLKTYINSLKGDWSDDSKLWTAEIKDIVHFRSKNDGIFFMCLEDFQKYFFDITICYFYDDFLYSSLKVKSHRRKGQYYRFYVK